MPANQAESRSSQDIKGVSGSWSSRGANLAAARHLRTLAISRKDCLRILADYLAAVPNYASLRSTPAAGTAAKPCQQVLAQVSGRSRGCEA